MRLGTMVLLLFLDLQLALVALATIPAIILGSQLESAPTGNLR
jgi:ABC-type bacteriocin/lantibiotic exporter with double-glycine peptidase domain